MSLVDDKDVMTLFVGDDVMTFLVIVDDLIGCGWSSVVVDSDVAFVFVDGIYDDVDDD